MSETGKKRKVLLLIESLSGGGAEKVLVTLLKHLDKSRFDVTLCCISNTGKFLHEIPGDVRYHYLLPAGSGLSAWGSFWYKIRYKLVYGLLPLRWVYRLAIPKGNEVEVAFTEGFATKLLASSSNGKAKKIAWVHIDLQQDPWTQARKIYRDLAEEKKCYAAYDSIVCVSESVAHAFKSVYAPASPVSVLYNPVDADDIRCRAKDSCPVSWGLNGQAVRLVSVGRLAHQKGYDRLLRICGQLRREGYRFELCILGEGNDRKELEQLIEAESLREDVRLPGFLANPYPLVASADLFVCPSRAEGYSTAVTESLILGVPVLATECAGMRELVGAHCCGIITDNNERAFYLGLKSLLENKAELSRLHEGACLRGNDFSLESSVQAIEDTLTTC